MLVLITIAISTFAIYHFLQLSDAIDKILRENYSSIIASGKMVQALEQQERALLGMFFGGIDSLQTVFYQNRDDFMRAHRNAERSTAIPEESAILDSISTTYTLYLTKADSLQDYLLAKGADRSTRVFKINVIQPITIQLKNHCQQLASINRNLLLETEDASKKLSQRAIIVLIIVSGIAVGISLVAAFQFTRYILRPIEKLTHSVYEISQGNLDQKVEITTNDEMALLGSEFNRMTERLQEFEKAKRAQLDRMKLDFMAIVSHEFRTPLTSINMSIDILSQEILGPLTEKQRELLLDAKNDCERLARLLKNLLNLSKLESGGYELDFVPTNLQELIENSIRPLRLSLKEKNIDVVISLPEDLPDLMADQQQLSWVFSNLVGNAIRYVPNGGKIKLAVERKQDWLEFCLEDNGVGIPEDALESIFEKFVQLKTPDEAAKGSVGLGLAIAREVVKAHSGRIRVESKVGEGSRFYFTIPMKIYSPEEPQTININHEHTKTQNTRC